MAVAMAALDAVVVVLGTSGKRRIRSSIFIADPATHRTATLC
jgi:CO/xanthine dehydrogenase FAD-binding subunit